MLGAALSEGGGLRAPCMVRLLSKLGRWVTTHLPTPRSL